MDARSKTRTYNPKMARSITRVKDVDPQTRRKNNEAARISRAKKKDAIYDAEMELHLAMKEYQSIVEELKLAKVDYVKNHKWLPPKKRATDPLMRVAVADELPKIDIPPSEEEAKRGKRVEKFLKKIRIEEGDVPSIFEDV